MNKKELKPLSQEILRSNSRRNIDELLTEALVKVEDPPYRVPNNWIWVKLDNLCKKIVDGTHETTRYVETGVPFISVKDIRHRKINFDGCKYISEKDHVILKKRCNSEKNDVLITKSGTIGRTAVVTFNLEFSLFSSVALLKPFSAILNSAFLAYGLESYINSIDVNRTIKGAVIKNFHISDLKKIKFPLAPLNEQLRIVEKLDSMLGKIAEARELIQEARESFEVRRNTIFHKAFNGELTKKWREENKVSEPATELLNRISLKNAGLKRAGKETEIQLHPPPFTLPKNWKWCKIDDLVSFIGSGMTPKGGRNIYIEKGVPFIRSQNVLNGKLCLEDIVYISKDIHNSMKRTMLIGGETLLNITGASIGRAVYVPSNFGEGNVNQHVCILRFQLLENLFPQYWLNSPVLQGIIMDIQSGFTRQGLNYNQIRGLPFPLPPLEEQKEIVRILKSLMRSEEEAKELIDLENCLDSLEKSILFKAFRGELGTNIPQDEQAIELLKRILLEKEEMKSIEPKQSKRGEDNMDENKRMKNSNKRFSLVETLKEANERVKPEILFERAGYSYETIEEFYRELKIFIENKEIFEERPNDSEVFLGISNHEDTKTMDKRV